MLYTVSEACYAPVCAWLVMCPRTVIIYIIIVYNLEHVSSCAYSVYQTLRTLVSTASAVHIRCTFKLTFLVRRATTSVASDTQTPRECCQFEVPHIGVEHRRKPEVVVIQYPWLIVSANRGVSLNRLSFVCVTSPRR